MNYLNNKGNDKKYSVQTNISTFKEFTEFYIWEIDDTFLVCKRADSSKVILPRISIEKIETL